jgi:hypothetical protein
LIITLQKLQAEIGAKEMEIDLLMERSQILYSGSAASRLSSVAKIGQKYQQLSTVVKVSAKFYA